jgi:hypothetical protein
MLTPSNHSKERKKEKKNYHPTATDDTNIANSVKPHGSSTNRKGRKTRNKNTNTTEKVNHPFIAPYLSILVYYLTHCKRKKGDQTEWWVIPFASKTPTPL